MSDGDTPEPWFKQFWPWFLIALPGSVVIASGITFYLAAAQPLEVDPSYGRRAMAVTVDAAPDAADVCASQPAEEVPTEGATAEAPPDACVDDATAEPAPQP